MTNAELIQTIRAEIERRKSLLTQHSKLTYDLILETFIKEYDDLLSFLSTLESEKPVPNDLEEAAENWSKENTRGFVLKDKTTRYVGDTIDAFIAGAKWDRSQILKEAVEGRIYKDEYAEQAPFYYVSSELFNLPPNMMNGDKVRIIIVKED